MNKVFLIGRLGNDPESKAVGSSQVVKFSLATDESYKDKSGQKVERTEWHRCEAWAGTASVIERFVRKGDRLAVEGSIATDTWEKDGEKKSMTKIRVSRAELISDKRSSAGGSIAPSASRSSGAPTNPLPDDDDQLPF